VISSNTALNAALLRQSLPRRAHSPNSQFTTSRNSTPACLPLQRALSEELEHSFACLAQGPCPCFFESTGPKRDLVFTSGHNNSSIPSSRPRDQLAWTVLYDAHEFPPDHDNPLGALLCSGPVCQRNSSTMKTVPSVSAPGLN
jgi:hypothetical protein